MRNNFKQTIGCFEKKTSCERFWGRCEVLRLECGERVLELGAGTGYVGLVVAALGHHVTLTEPGTCWS